jgi:ubiquinone biosynthesis protein
MSLLETGMVAIRDRKRLAEIAAILARFGSGNVLSRIGLSGLLPLSCGMVGPKVALAGKGKALAVDLAGLSPICPP